MTYIRAAMKNKLIVSVFSILVLCAAAQAQTSGITLQSSNLKDGRTLVIDGLFLETTNGRVPIAPVKAVVGVKPFSNEVSTSDGHKVTLSIQPQGSTFNLSLKAQPDSDITKWGLALASQPTEYYTGLMERVVDGPQAKSWATGIQEAMNLRGQKVDMIIKPTTSVYAPYYLSSRGYAAFVKGTWPAYFDFAVSDPKRVKIEFEGPNFE